MVSLVFIMSAVDSPFHKQILSVDHAHGDTPCHMFIVTTDNATNTTTIKYIKFSNPWSLCYLWFLSLSVISLLSLLYISLSLMSLTVIYLISLSLSLSDIGTASSASSYPGEPTKLAPAMWNFPGTLMCSRYQWLGVAPGR